jgi:hypothetical protein
VNGSEPKFCARVEMAAWAFRPSANGIAKSIANLKIWQVRASPISYSGGWFSAFGEFGIPALLLFGLHRWSRAGFGGLVCEPYRS